MRDRDRDRERETETERARDRHRETERERQTERQTQRESPAKPPLPFTLLSGASPRARPDLRPPQDPCLPLSAVSPRGPGAAVCLGEQRAGAPRQPGAQALSPPGSLCSPRPRRRLAGLQPALWRVTTLIRDVVTGTTGAWPWICFRLL